MRARTAFLHLPKAAGTSIRAALSSYYRESETVPWSFGRDLFGDFDRLDEVEQPIFLGDPAQFREFRFMQGHWSLPALLSAFEPADVACVLREPRTRFLSQYAYWRSWSSGAHDAWDPFDASRLARQPLGQFASEKRIASISDNLTCRLLLGANPLIPTDAAISGEHIEAVAAQACAELDRLGFVDVIERGPEMYQAIEQWFGSPLEIGRLNETASEDGERVPLDDLLSPRTLRLLNERNAADLIVWEHVVERRDPAVRPRPEADSTYGAAVARMAVTSCARGHAATLASEPLHRRARVLVSELRQRRPRRRL